MAVTELTVKARILRHSERMDEGTLAALETKLDELEKPSPEEIERRLNAWRGIFGLLADPEEYAEFEKYARRRPLFGGRSLDLEPDDDASGGEA